MPVNCGFIPIFIVPEKFQQKYIKNSVTEDSGSPKESRRGPPSSQAAKGREPTPVRARRTLGRRAPPLVPPFGLYLHAIMETLGRHLFSRYSPLFRRRGDSKIGSA